MPCLAPRPSDIAPRLLDAPQARFLALAVLLVALLAAAPPRALAQYPVPVAEAAPQVDISALTAEERADLLSRLSDEQVRELMHGYLLQQAAAEAKSTPMIEEFHQDITLFRENLGALLSHFRDLPSIPSFVYAKLAEGKGPYHPLIVLALFIGITLLAFAAERGYRWIARRAYLSLELPKDAEPLQRLGRLLARLFLDLVGLVVFAAAILSVFFLLYQGHGPTRLTVMSLLTAMLIVRATSVVSRFFFAPFASNLRIAPFADDVARSIHQWILAITSITAFGLLICALMLNLGLSQVQHDLIEELVGIVLVSTIVVGVLKLRRSVADALLAQIEGEGHGNRLMRILASFWHVGFIGYVLVLYILSVYRSLIGQEMSSYPALLSLVILLLLPAADFFLRCLLDDFFPAKRAEGSRSDTDALPVFKRAARILLVVLAVFLIGRVWGVDFFAMGQAGIGEDLMRAVVDIALTLLAAYVAWGVIKAALARYMPAQEEGEGHGGDEGGAGGATRLETVMPLIMRFIQVTLAAIVVMILLSSLGVDIGPLLAGAGVVGLAVGFGAQTLVRDVVSGLFFLLDDAFRKGEYVDIGSVKGTVEAIHVRSRVLRHHLGPLHTVPYGEIQHLTNFSRDWVIMKMEFRVPTDTDINKVKKLFKQIGADMLEHPEFGPDFLEPFKSQGVKSIEDSAIIVRGKFMSRPGKQFVLRKELYNRVQKIFQENGIQFAHRKVTVELPPDLKLSDEERKQVAEAAGAAAIATEPAKP